MIHSHCVKRKYATREAAHAEIVAMRTRGIMLRGKKKDSRLRDGQHLQAYRCNVCSYIAAAGGWVSVWHIGHDPKQNGGKDGKRRNRKK